MDLMVDPSEKYSFLKKKNFVLDQAAESAHPVSTEAADHTERSRTARTCRQKQEKKDYPTV